MEMLIAVGIFIVVLCLIEGSYFALRNLRDPEKKRVRRRLQAFSTGLYESESIDIIRRRSLSEIPWFNRLLSKIRWTHQVDRLLQQADIRRPLGFFILLSLVLAGVGFWSGSLVTKNYLITIPWVAFLGAMPFVYIYSKKRQRMKKFMRQLPDAMELIARSLRAGHAFASGLKMVGDEFDDPISAEFDRTLNEINFGVSVPDALKSLLNRVDCPDLHYFVISVILQRETGGNLAEILDNIAHIIRQRFKLQGNIRTLSAEGRLSAIILIAMPFVIAFILSLINPGYIGVLLTDPIGNIMMAGAIIMMILGIIVIRRLIDLRV